MSLLALPAAAGPGTEMRIAGGFNYTRWTKFAQSTSGIGVELSAGSLLPMKRLEVVGDFGVTGGLLSGRFERDWSMAGGVRYVKPVGAGPVRIYGQALVGTVRWTLPQQGFGNRGFAFGTGIGVDGPVWSRLFWKAQVDVWFPRWARAAPDGNLMRFVVGMELKLP